MMKTSFTARLILLVSSTIALVSTTVDAQTRMPHAGANAIGAEVGVFPPRADHMTTGLNIAGTFEHYLSARDSLRFGVDWAEPKVEVERSDSMRQVRVGADLVHNWEGGTVHPFVGAGLGAYFLQARDNGRPIGDSATRFGGTLLGGVEFFTSRTFAVKAEARYHVVTKWNGYDPSGFGFTIGVKGYF
jgi:hypothetical protein